MKCLKAQHPVPLEEKPIITLGRKRDNTIDIRILEATTKILGEVGFDSMTMDMVVAEAKVGKASVYRRWSSKSDLVNDALTWMSQNHLELDSLPDTGSLRSDLLAVLKSESIEDRQRNLSVLAGLGSFLSQDKELIETGKLLAFEPWMKVNRAIMQRAIERNELPQEANIEMTCQVITSIVAYHGLILNKAFDTAAFMSLLDSILLPALKNPASKP